MGMGMGVGRGERDFRGAVVARDVGGEGRMKRKEGTREEGCGVSRRCGWCKGLGVRMGIGLRIRGACE